MWFTDQLILLVYKKVTVPISHIKNLTTLISVRVDIECHILTCIHREIETLDIKQLLSDIKKYYTLDWIGLWKICIKQNYIYWSKSRNWIAWTEKKFRYLWSIEKTGPRRTDRIDREYLTISFWYRRLSNLTYRFSYDFKMKKRTRARFKKSNSIHVDRYANTWKPLTSRVPQASTAE